MRDDILKCTNCGKISPRDHILPLCDECFIGLEDYEDFVAKSNIDVEITIDRKQPMPDEFLRI
ncbi:MAG: hypothetical protein GY839_16160 [candidate division Zixibacteria bacterium]|nr:hypothetical protein [candidate division Zixibacteria bacterium]